MSSSIDALVADVRDRLVAQWLGRRIEAVDSTPSTNELAREGLMQGHAPGTVYLADYQTKGRGRLGRRWSAEPGVNLTFSVLLRPRAEHVGLTTIAAAVGLRRAVSHFVSATPIHIKWPNDLLIEHRKCSGMLLEHVMQAEQSGVVLGIGLNVNQGRFSSDDAPNATSLLLATGRIIPRHEVLMRILKELEAVMDDLGNGHSAALISEYQRHMYRIGREVELFLTGNFEPVKGRVVGVESTGALQLETADGLQAFYAGDLTTNVRETS